MQPDFQALFTASYDGGLPPLLQFLGTSVHTHWPHPIQARPRVPPPPSMGEPVTFPTFSTSHLPTQPRSRLGQVEGHWKSKELLLGEAHVLATGRLSRYSTGVSGGFYELSMWWWSDRCPPSNQKTVACPGEATRGDSGWSRACVLQQAHGSLR